MATREEEKAGSAICDGARAAVRLGAHPKVFAEGGLGRLQKYRCSEVNLESGDQKLVHPSHRPGHSVASYLGVRVGDRGKVSAANFNYSEISWGRGKGTRRF